MPTRRTVPKPAACSQNTRQAKTPPSKPPPNIQEDPGATVSSHYPRTHQALQSLLSHLHCDHCSGTLHKFYTLGGQCEHVLCENCVDPQLGLLDHGCPVCGQPCKSRDVHLHGQWEQVVLISRKLLKLIAAESLEEEMETENISQETELMPPPGSWELTSFDRNGAARKQVLKPRNQSDRQKLVQSHNRDWGIQLTLTDSTHSEKSPYNTDACRTPLDVPAPKPRAPCPPPRKRSLEPSVDNQVSASKTRRSISVIEEQTGKDNIKESERPLHGRPPLPPTRGRITRSFQDKIRGSIIRHSSAKPAPLPQESSADSEETTDDTMDTSPPQLDGVQYTGGDKNKFKTSTGSLKSVGQETSEKSLDGDKEVKKKKSFFKSRFSKSKLAVDHIEKESDSKDKTVAKASKAKHKTSSSSLATINPENESDSKDKTVAKASKSKHKTSSSSLATINQEDEKSDSKDKTVAKASKSKRKISSSSLSINNTEKEFIQDKPEKKTSFFKRKDSKSKLKISTGKLSAVEPKDLNHSLASVDLSSPLTPKQVSKRNVRGETPLQQAAIKGDYEKICRLIKLGADVNTRDNAGWTPLHETANRGAADCMEALLLAGAKANQSGGEGLDTPLHDAAENGWLECARLLIQHGARSDVKNVRGITPLMLGRKWPVMVELLETAVGNEVDIDLSSKGQGSTGLTAPVMACSGLDRKQRATLTSVVAMLGGQLVESYSSSASPVTHLIVKTSGEQGTCPRTLKYLMAVLQGHWVVGYEWIRHCAHLQARVLEEPFEVPGCNTHASSLAPRKGRLSRDHGGAGLFAGCQFLLRGEFKYPNPSREDLIALLQAGDAKVLSRAPPSAATITTPVNVAEDSTLNRPVVLVVMDDLRVAPSSAREEVLPQVRVTPVWIMDCVGDFRIIDPPDREI